MSIIASMIHSKYIIQVSDSRGTMYKDSNIIVIDNFKKTFKFGQNIGVAYAGILMTENGSIKNAVDIFTANMDLTLPIPQIAQNFYDYLRKYWPQEAKFVFHLGGYRDGEPYLFSGFWPGAEGEPPTEPIESIQPGVLIINQHCIEKVTLWGRELPDLLTLPYPHALNLIEDKVFEAVLTSVDCGGHAQNQIITHDRVSQFKGKMAPAKSQRQRHIKSIPSY